MTSDKPSEPSPAVHERLEKGRMYYATNSRLPFGKELVRANLCIFPVFIVCLHTNAEQEDDVSQGAWFMELRSSPEMVADGEPGETTPVDGWIRPSGALSKIRQDVEILFLPGGIAQVTITG